MGTSERCGRCAGLVVWAQYADHERQFVGGRCLNCGHYGDRVACRNRVAPLPKGWHLEEAGARRPHHNVVGRTSEYDLRRTSCR